MNNVHWTMWWTLNQLNAFNRKFRFRNGKFKLHLVGMMASNHSVGCDKSGYLWWDNRAHNYDRQWSPNDNHRAKITVLIVVHNFWASRSSSSSLKRTGRPTSRRFCCIELNGNSMGINSQRPDWKGLHSMQCTRERTVSSEDSSDRFIGARSAAV